jgi:hypothetical protein
MNRQEHIITVLAEEGGEVAKECHKSLRFGLDDKLTLDPRGPRGTAGPTTAEKIAAEFIDMVAVYQMATAEGLVPSIGLSINDPATLKRIALKQERVEAFMGYAQRVGALEIPQVPAPTSRD